MLVNKSGASFVNDGALISNQFGALLVNKGIGTTFSNQDYASLLNTAATLINESGALFTNTNVENDGSGTILINQGGGALKNAGAGTAVINTYDASLRQEHRAE